MKVICFAIIALLCQLLQLSAQTSETTLNTLTSESATGLDLISPPEPADAAPFIEDSLGIPAMRDQLTITESSQGLSLGVDDIDTTYGKMVQEFAATLEGNNASPTARIRAPKLGKLLDILLCFGVETIITLLVLKITFQLGEYRARFHNILPICLAIASAGALLRYFVGINLFHPIQVGVSSFLLLMILRLATDVHEWAPALQITFAARLASLGVLWLTYTGMGLLFGL